MPQRNIPQPPLPPPNCNDPHPPQCENIFDRVHVCYLIKGGTRVMWDLLPEFCDPHPYTFQLQVGMSGNPWADDWQNVGLPVVNSFYAIDGEQRVWGKTNWTHYRVKLMTARGTYYSEPTNGMGVLSRRDWRLAKEIVRQETLRHRYASCDGFLLKKREGGVPCYQCTDLQTDEILDPDCEVCFGTGYQGGYYYPMDGVWCDIAPKTKRKELDNQGQRGVILDIVVSGRMLMLPLIQEYDVWVGAKTDDRYYIHRIQDVAEIRCVPLVANVELRPAPFTDVIYTIPIPQREG